MIKKWREQWLDSICMVADRASQHRHWFVCDQPEGIGWQFTEMCCQYFNDLFLDKGFEYLVAKGYVSTSEAQAVATFHSMYDGYTAPNGDYDHKAIYDDPVWHKLNVAAQQACVALQPLLSDDSEIQIVQRIIEQSPGGDSLTAAPQE